jgi:hypothetical protein
MTRIYIERKNIATWINREPNDKETKAGHKSNHSAALSGSGRSASCVHKLQSNYSESFSKPQFLIGTPGICM